MLESVDLFALEEDDRCEAIWARFQSRVTLLQARYHGRESRKVGSGLLLAWALVSSWPLLFALQGIFLLGATLLQFGVPLSLKYLVSFITTYDPQPQLPTLVLAAAATLFVAPCLTALCNGQQFQIARRLIFRCGVPETCLLLGATCILTGPVLMSCRYRAALISVIYRQTLRLDLHAASAGQVTNLCSVDANASDAARCGHTAGRGDMAAKNTTSRTDLEPAELTDVLRPLGCLCVCRYIHNLWSTALQIVVSTSLLFYVLGRWQSGLVGVVFMAVSIPFTGAVSRRLQAAQKGLMRRKDERLSLLGEVLQGVRVVKLLALERHFLTQVGTRTHRPAPLFTHLADRSLCACGHAAGVVSCTGAACAAGVQPLRGAGVAAVGRHTHLREPGHLPAAHLGPAGPAIGVAGLHGFVALRAAAGPALHAAHHPQQRRQGAGRHQPLPLHQVPAERGHR